MLFYKLQYNHRLTNSTRPKPPTPRVAINERSFRSNSAIAFGIFLATFPMFIRFSDETITLRNILIVSFSYRIKRLIQKMKDPTTETSYGIIVPLYEFP